MEVVISFGVLVALAVAIVVRNVNRFARAGPGKKRKRSPLDEPVWTVGGFTVLTRRLLNRGVFVTGQTGSGKTSAVVNGIVRACMRKGYGLVLIAPKPGDADNYRRLARECGRDDVTVLDDSGRERVSLVRTLLNAKGSPATLAAVAEAGLSTIGQVIGEEGSKGEDSSFWVSATKNYTRTLFLAHLLANVEPTPHALMALVNAIPRTPQERGTDEFKTGYCHRLLKAAEARARANGWFGDFKVCADHLLDSLPRLAPRTRSVIEAIVHNSLAPLLSGVGAEVLAGAPTFDLGELIRRNGILICDFPLAYYQEVGRAIGACIKFLAQREAMRRVGGKPCVIVIDEGAQYLTRFDSEYVSISRSFEAPMVVCLQCVSQLARSESDTKTINTLSGNLATIVGCSATATTAEWLSRIIGKTRQMFGSGSVQTGGYESPWDVGRSTSSGGFSESYSETVRPEDLRMLRCGGEENDNLVDAVLIQPGRPHAFLTLPQG